MGVISALRGTTLSAENAEPRSAACLNCGAPLTGPFCAQCGQRDVPPYPSVRELVVDAFWELSGWDGRFASTVRALATKPGFLTREFLEGRRARYISPLRLYLMASLAYFLIAAAAPDIPGASGGTVRLGGSSTTATAQGPRSRPAQVAGAAEDALRSQKPISPAKRDSILTQIAKAPPVMQPFLQRAILDPTGFKRAVIEAMPKMLFALLPVFAAIVAIFYHRRKYPEHLYFAIHLHAFVFVALSIAALAKFTHLAGVALLLGFVALAWIPIYTTLAFRRAYGGSLATTLVKEIGIGAIYGAVSLTAFIATLYIVSRFG